MMNKRVLIRNFIDRINKIKDNLRSSRKVHNNLMKVNFRDQFRDYYYATGQELEELKVCIYILPSRLLPKLRGLVHVLPRNHPFT